MVTFINIILTFILKGHLKRHGERGKLERVNNMQRKELDLNLGLLPLLMGHQHYQVTCN